MSDERSQDPGGASGEDGFLRSVFQSSGLDQEALERIRSAVEREWRAAMDVGDGGQGAALASRVGWFALAAAAALAVAGVTFWVARPPGPAARIGMVTRTDDGALAVSSTRLPARILTQGGELRVGDRVTARGSALVSLAGGGTLRISAKSELAVISPGQIALKQGLIYLDIPPAGGAAGPLRILTSAGAIEHVGTEFEVLGDEHAVRVRVREGRIRFVGKTATVVADAGTELLAAPGQSIVKRPIDTYGRDWSWAAALAPDYEIEGRSLMGFLRWVSRELGRPLNFVDANAKQVADRTILHGSVHHQAPLDAMNNVLATTSLTYEIRGDSIWVRSSTSAAL